MAGTMRVPRSRGGLSGTLLTLLGVWGGLIPFVGPYADFGFSPDKPWVYDTDRLLLSVAPGVATGLGGLIVLFSSLRAFAMFGAWLAALGGAWFAVGAAVATLWKIDGVGAPLGTTTGRHVAEQLTAFSGLGVVIVFFAALALGRFAVVGVKETQLAEERAEHAAAVRAAQDGSGTTQPLAPSQGRYGRTPPVLPQQRATGPPEMGRPDTPPGAYGPGDSRGPGGAQRPGGPEDGSAMPHASGAPSDHWVAGEPRDGRG